MEQMLEAEKFLEEAKKNNSTSLNLPGLNLGVLPEGLAQLTNLTYLDLNGNQLTTLPEGLAQLTNLRWLDLEGNDKLNIPAEILSLEEPAKILDYYFRTKESQRPINEAKLIFVGRGGGGKTSLVNRLVKDKFNKDEDITHGINITQWPVKIAGDDVRLNIWDFGGQEIMHATHQFFMTQRSLYVLVLNNREGGGESDADYWLKLIESFAGDSPVIVVLNKIKASPFDVNRQGLRRKYPFIKEFIETDCKDKTGIDSLHDTVLHEADRLEHLRDAFPSSWFEIKDRLGQMADNKENYLTFERYRDICGAHGESDTEAQDSLAIFLHNLGVALNYKDDHRLRDVHVLNPHWVTNGIYKILTAESLFHEEGRLNISFLPKLLDKIDYPPERHSFLINLMRKFELCFSFSEDEGSYLVPELLSIQQPSTVDELLSNSSLCLEYHYPILPEGLLPRFIVRTKSLSNCEKRWRTGVLLEFEQCRALVIADVQDKKIVIHVTGDRSGKRRLLAIIRSDLDNINSNFSFKPEEMVPIPDAPGNYVSYQELLAFEQDGYTTLPKAIGSKVKKLNVKSLLNGIDSEEERNKTKEQEAKVQSLKLFYSYAHKDEELRDNLESHLKILERHGLIQPWHDRDINTGDDWKKEINSKLEHADIILLLISANFIDSDYCYELEMKKALERNKNGEARVIPIIIKDCNWHSSPFAKLQALPKEGKAVNSWSDKDVAWASVSKSIEEIIKKTKDQRLLDSL